MGWLQQCFPYTMLEITRQIWASSYMLVNLPPTVLAKCHKKACVGLTRAPLLAEDVIVVQHCQQTSNGTWNSQTIAYSVGGNLVWGYTCRHTGNSYPPILYLGHMGTTGTLGIFQCSLSHPTVPWEWLNTIGNTPVHTTLTNLSTPSHWYGHIHSICCGPHNLASDHFTALMALCCSNCQNEEGLVKCARLLVNNGARINAHDRYRALFSITSSSLPSPSSPALPPLSQTPHYGSDLCCSARGLCSGADSLGLQCWCEPAGCQRMDGQSLGLFSSSH